MKNSNKLFFSIIAIIIFSFAIANANNPFAKNTVFTTSKQPSFIYTGYGNSASTPFFLCSGQDVDFNGKFDEGDERPSAYAYKIKYFNPIVKVTDLELENLTYNLRPGIDELESKAYIPSGDYIYIYSFPFFNKIIDSIYSPLCRAVEVTENHIYVSSSDYSNPGKIYKYTKFDLNLVDSIDSDPLPFQLFALPNFTLAYINEGFFGTETGKITFIDIDNNNFKVIKELHLGNTPNHISICGNYLYITLNGGHKVMILDYINQSIIDSIAIPTEGNDGPRQTLVLNRTNSEDYKQYDFFTTAYDGHIYYGKGNEILEKSENNNKKREAIAYYSEIDAIIVSDISNQDYSPANTITVYEPYSSVKEKYFGNLNIYPNPTSDYVNFSLNSVENTNCTVFIYDLLGNVILETKSEISSGNCSINIQDLNLSKSTYFIKVISPTDVYKSKFTIK